MAKKKHILIWILFVTRLIGLCQFDPPQFSRAENNASNETCYPMDLLMDKYYRYWIASFNGLIEYNGNSFKTHHMPLFQNKLLGSDYISRILSDNDSMLWVAHGNGVARFNLYRKTFELIPISNCTACTALNFFYIFKDSQGNVFFISIERGVLFYDPLSKSLKPASQFNTSQTGYIFKITESSDHLFYLLHTRKGLLLYNTKDKQLQAKDNYPKEFEWLLKKEVEGTVNDFIEIDHLKYLSLRDTGEKNYSILEYNSFTNTFKKLPLTSNKGRLFFKDSAGHLWLYGFGDQAAIYDPQSGILHHLPDQKNAHTDIDFSLCYSVVEDHENTVWLCTNSGLLNYNQFQNSSALLSKNLPLNIYSDISEIEKYKLWFGTLYNGIYEYNANTKQFKNFNLKKLSGDIAYNDIWQINPSKDNNDVWVIHTAGKISRFNKKEQKFYFYNDSIFKDEQLSITEDNKGNIYVATQSGQLLIYETKTDKFDRLFHLGALKFQNDKINVSDIIYANGDKLLIGTSGEGLVILNLKDYSSKIFKAEPDKQNSIRSNIINVLKTFDNETFYAGTANGIFSFNIRTEEIENFNYDERFNLGYVYQITSDKAQNLIFTGTNKMFLLNWKTKDIIDLGKKSNIDQNNLTEVHFSQSLNKLFVLSEESIFEIKLNPKNFAPSIKPIIYSIESYDKSFLASNEGAITLDPTQNSFQLSFGSSTYKFKDDLEYYYSLNNGEWFQAKTRYITFSKLPGGNYTFRLKLVYKGNRSYVSETFLNIDIRKRFHETFWFYLLILSVLIGVFYFIYRVRLNKLLAVEKIRFQLSRDLHDDMGSTLSTINILSAIAADKIEKDPQSTRSYIQRISSNSEQMMESMDDIVWSINPANDSMKKVIYRMREFASGILEPKNIDLLFETDDNVQQLSLNMAMRRDFFLIYKEAINNAAKYSQCSKLKVSFRIENKHLVLLIKDNGKGFEIKEYEHGNGLVNMRKRAAQIKASFNISSENGQGTTIEIQLNLHNL